MGGKLHLICVVLCAETCFPLSTLFTVSALSLLPCVHLSHPSDAHLHCPTSPVIMGRTMLTSRSLCNQLRRGAVLLFLATTQGHSSLHIYPESMCVLHVLVSTSSCLRHIQLPERWREKVIMTVLQQNKGRCCFIRVNMLHTSTQKKIPIQG